MKTKFLKVIGLLIIGNLLITACGLGTIQGSGDVITESRDVSGFDSVSLTGIGRVIITQGEAESLTIETDDNLMKYITSEVRDGTLELDFTENVRFDPIPSIVFRVSAKNLSAIDSVGTGTIEMGKLTTDQLEISTSGTGSIIIDELTATDLVAAAEGTGEIKLAGNVETQEITQVGTGNYDASDLESQTAAVRITGTGSVMIWVLDSLDVGINGVGEVSYFGSPNVTQSITGNGSLTSLGDK
jgi:hypothetical protein